MGFQRRVGVGGRKTQCFTEPGTVRESTNDGELRCDPVCWEVQCHVQDPIPSQEKGKVTPSHLSRCGRPLCPHPRPSLVLWKEGIQRADHITSGPAMAWLLTSFSLSCPGGGHHRSPLDVACCLINRTAELIKLIFLLSLVSQI